ncbi:hypothetical protein [Sporomusa sp. KB1]|jgi:hypothetical protein|uniref:hypothetical protein n=1 Tax=Sporomusa sp. KB1 TaxID=943346 RepID=UPI0011AD1AF2|nr:hypothetical protein [Sporomusa sp. KB1]TWH45921.1 hypothetical protein Salpa_1853 [Sporomusa sp. KB1]
MPECVIYDTDYQECRGGLCTVYRDQRCCRNCDGFTFCLKPCLDIRQDRPPAVSTLQKVRRNSKKQYWFHLVSAVLILALLTLTLVSCGANYEPQKKELVIVNHVVVDGENLWNVAAQYITPDRDIREFMEGIYELNYDRVFGEREQNGMPRKSVFPGDTLEIRYWKSVD